ncbi:serine protease [Amylostereum chailletii]|nr:serine protease [Amylostereum chailletii]
MRLSAVFTSLALLVAPILAAPTTLLEVHSFAGETSGRHIVQLKATASKDAHLEWFDSVRTTGSSVTHADWDAEFLNGYAGQFDVATLNMLRASPDVESIEEDGIMHTTAFTTETNAPWGLARLSQAGRVSGTDTALNHAYTYDTAGGAGVDVYVVDTGINTAHTDFGGRARLGAVFGSAQNVDGNGHGTHVSGTVAGTRFGVAKSASLIAVKVLSDSGSGTVSDIVSGLNFVATSARSSGRPSIATMSLGGAASTSLDNAVASLTSAGIHVTVAAGNEAQDASNDSPARAPSANTVGASTIADAIASFSNFGSVVDIFAPGLDVTSAWIGSNTATNTISGTSMATPHVAGLIAYYISRNGNQSPAALSSFLKTKATTNALSGLPSGTGNRLARNDA